MKWILLVLLLISCTKDEDMRLFVNTGTSGGSSPLPELPPNGVRVLFLTGQSNAYGLGENSDATASELLPNNDFRIWDDSEFQPLEIGVNNGGSGPDTHGIELGLSVNLNTYFPDETIYIVKNAKGGQEILYFMPNGGLGNFYALTRKLWRKALNDLIESGKIPFPYILWHQGESDGFDDLYQLYRGKYNELSNIWVQTFGNDIPVTLMEITEYRAGVYSPEKTQMIPVLHQIASDKTQTNLSLDKDLSTLADRVHFDYTGFKAMSLLHLDGMVQQPIEEYSDAVIQSEIWFYTKSTSATFSPSTFLTDGTTVTWQVIMDSQSAITKTENEPTFDLSSNTGRGAIVFVRSDVVNMNDVLEIDMSNMNLTEMEIGELYYLPKLDVSNNQISETGGTRMFAPEWVDISNNQISDLPLTKTYLTYADISNNLFDAAYVDNHLIEIDAAGLSNGTTDISGNATRTSASDTAYNNLITKNWTITE